MEDALVLDELSRGWVRRNVPVLILVLMEDALVPLEGCSLTNIYES